MAHFIVKEEEGIKKRSPCMLLDKEHYISLSNKVRLQILELLADKPMFISEIGKKLHLHEQNVYYHLKDMKSLLEVVEEKKVRGTIAKKYKAKAANFCLSVKDAFLDYNEQSAKVASLNPFFAPFIENGELNAKIVVGSPDPHGQHKARARDGHYAIDLAFFLGNHCALPKDFSVSLDVDIKLKDAKEHLIIVGGPVTNLLTEELNQFLSVSFKEERHWAIKSKKSTYADDNTGLIARVPNPYNNKYWIMLVAGVRFSGTKAAVIGLTRKTQLVLTRYTGQKEFYSVIEGYDLDGDGKIDSVELLE
jgi:DNA-binding transcriptional ArsR family regulator